MSKLYLNGRLCNGIAGVGEANQYTLKELKQLAKDNGMKGVSGLNKEELCLALGGKELVIVGPPKSEPVVAPAAVNNSKRIQPPMIKEPAPAAPAAVNNSKLIQPPMIKEPDGAVPVIVPAAAALNSGKLPSGVKKAADGKNITVEKVLGQGSYGRVERVIDHNDGSKKKAIKTQKLVNNSINHAGLREIMIIQYLNHPNILSTDPIVFNDGSKKAVWADIKKGELYLSLENMKSTLDMFYVPAFYAPNPAELRDIFRQINDGLYYMHSMGYTHNDLKLQNVLFKVDDAGKYIVKIADFGLSQYIGSPFPIKVNQFLCTPRYKAPNNSHEPFYHQGNRYNYNSDMYSLGAIMYYLCALRNGITYYHTDSLIDFTKPYFTSIIPKLKEMYGEEGFDFMKKCLEPDSKLRISSKKALQHPYLLVQQKGGLSWTYQFLTNLYKDTTFEEFTNNFYELEYLEDSYQLYKDYTITTYIPPKAGDDVNFSMYNILSDWVYTIFTGRGMPMLTLETYIQYSLLLVNHLNWNKPIRTNLQLIGCVCGDLSNKLTNDFASTPTIFEEDFVPMTDNTITADALKQHELLYLNGTNMKLLFTPTIFFVNYWYLKAVYTHADHTPNFNAFIHALVYMIILTSSYSNPKMINVLVDQMGKYCVKKGLEDVRHTDKANMDILTIDPENIAIFDECVEMFKKNAVSKPSKPRFVQLVNILNNNYDT
jgi:serine/threonine protein kinase